MKIGTVAVGAVLLLALSAPVAQGKGDLVPATWRAAVIGPGLPGSVDFHLRGGCEPRGTRCGSLGTGPGSSLDSLSFFENAGLAYPLWANQRLAMAGSSPSPDSLGQRYSIVTRFTSRGRTFVVHQELYPYGSSPWLYTPAGQTLPYQALRAGWSPAATLTNLLGYHGLPAEASPQAPIPPASSAEPRHGLPLWLFAGLFGTVAVAVLVLWGGQRNRPWAAAP